MKSVVRITEYAHKRGIYAFTLLNLLVCL